MSNTETVRTIYAAFGRGDMSTILENLSEDIEWEYGVNSTDVPWLQPRRGLQGAAEFFQSLSALDFVNFRVNHVIGDGDVVIGLVDVEATVRATGAKVSELDEVHVWYFGGDGKARRFRHRADTHQHWMAYHGG